MDCPFCSLPRERLVFESELAFVLRDAFPVSPGHTLVIPKKKFVNVFDAD
jgi:diadenosine tetraphosphate (Ap4A) HIT family hydrolase